MITFDPDGLEQRAAELEAKMGEPGFWNDQQGAAQISSEHARVQRRLERYERLRREYDDARELLAMDGDMAGEIETSLRPLESELERLQEDALFSGDYDEGDAVVTIQSDAGGTDAQDFTEMLLRMYERWAQNRGFKTEVLEASPGEEAASSPRRSRSRAKMRTESFGPSAASTVSSACPRSTRPIAATRPSPR